MRSRGMVLRRRLAFLTWAAAPWNFAPTLVLQPGEDFGYLVAALVSTPVKRKTVFLSQSRDRAGTDAEQLLNRFPRAKRFGNGLWCVLTLCICHGVISV